METGPGGTGETLDKKEPQRDIKNISSSSAPIHSAWLSAPPSITAKACSSQFTQLRDAEDTDIRSYTTKLIPTA